ncbi:MAG: hypothetical protein KAT32_05235 [Candidatus Moranbacteria bacterium]|nr:hypothetical protein [Candidatus Moranbacteria bacterium]
MTIEEIIKNINDFSDSERATIYAEKLNNKWLLSSEAIVLELTEDEAELSIEEISKKYTPGKEYFLEIFLIKELMDGCDEIDKKIIEIIIYYAENDA